MQQDCQTVGQMSERQRDLPEEGELPQEGGRREEQEGEGDLDEVGENDAQLKIQQNKNDVIVGSSWLPLTSQQT